tara:strand:+ start:21361 stop:21900 length:540 start_codon:yes stop_codon:yes gene_type:complete
MAAKLTFRLRFASMRAMKDKMTDPLSLTLTLADEKATLALGRRLAPLLTTGDFVAFTGDLGAGKTALARAIIQARYGAGGEEEDVPSPTFTLIQTYETPDLLITHADLYRLDDPDDLRELGLGEALDEGAVLMEWPDRMGALPATRLDIVLSLEGENARRVQLTAHGASWVCRLDALKL